MRRKIQIMLQESERNPGTFSLPVRLIKKPPENGKFIDIKIYPGGYVEVHFNGGMAMHELNQYIRDKIYAHFHSQLPDQDYFWRGTNNKQEIQLIRAGELQRSINHTDNRREKGLSVTDHMGYIMMCGYKYGYRIRGQVICYGSDGEPILDMTCLVPLDEKPRTQANIKRNEEKQHFATLRKIIKKSGWTIEQYKASIWAFAVEAEEFKNKYLK